MVDVIFRPPNIRHLATTEQLPQLADAIQRGFEMLRAELDKARALQTLKATPIIRSDYSAAPNQLVLVDPSDGAVNITMPLTDKNDGAQLIVMNVSESTNAITMVARPGTTVSDSAVISTAGGRMHFFCSEASALWNQPGHENAADPHEQYLLIDGSRAMAGNLDMADSDIVGVDDIHLNGGTIPGFLGSYDSGNTDITGLVSGTAAGVILASPVNSHLVFGIRENSADDSVAIVSGSGNYSSDSTFDKLVAQLRADGNVGIGEAAGTSHRVAISDDRDGFAVRILNDGNNANRRGLAIVCGEDTPASATSATFIEFREGDNAVTGSITANGSGVVALNSSDERKKRDIKAAKVDCLSIVQALRLVEFDWIKSGRHVDLGLVAQDVEKVYPQAVGELTDGTKAIARSMFVDVLIGAIQQLASRIDALEGAR